MRYYAPFGSIDPNASYVDRNTPGAVSGSRVPKEAIEMTQREIVDVITKAGLNPNDTLQLWDAIGASFTIKTPVSKTVYGPAADFPDFNAAHDWLSRFRIISGGSVRFILPAGRFYGLGDQYISHVDGSRVSIEGAPLTGGGAPAEPHFFATGYTAPARIADKTSNLNMLRARFATELSFVGSGHLRLGNIGAIQDVFLTGDGTGVDGLTIIGAEGLSVRRIAVLGFGGRGIVSAKSRLATENIYGVANGTGISFEAGSDAFMELATFGFGNAGDGFSTTGSTVAAVVGGAGAVISKGNGGNGVSVGFMGAMQTGGTINNKSQLNGGCGWLVNTGSYLRAPYSYATHNGLSGWSADFGGKMEAQYSTGVANGTGYAATNDSFIDATGATGGSASPALNTPGNSNSMIKG